MAWYILQTNTNYEAKVIEGINKLKSENNLTKVREEFASKVREIFAPEELIVEYKDGKKKEKMKKLYTNYIYIEMDYEPEFSHIFKGIRGVVGLLGDKNRPSVIPDAEVAKLKAQLSGDTPKPKVVFELEENVRIKSGAFADFNAVVKGVDYEKNKIKVELKVFGRETITEMSMSEVETVRD